MAPLHVAIVGAGIGGPVAAIELSRNGHKVTLYERSRTEAEVGYAFRLTPNSDRVLKYVGIDAEAGGAVAANVTRKFDMHGNPQQEAFRENQGPPQAQQAKSVFASRQLLSKQLMEKALSCGVDVKSGVEVVKVDVEETSITLGDGAQVAFDLVIAADGVNSVVRPDIADPTVYAPKSSTGHNAFRFMLPKEHVLKDEVTSATFGQDSRMFTWMGNSKMILTYPVEFDKQLNVVCTHPEGLSDTPAVDEDSSEDTVYNRKVSRDIAVGIYHDFDSVARRLVEMADPDGLRVWKLMDMDEIPVWSRNRTVLIGDACHPVLPFSFSGASMAIEDAITVALLLPGETAPSDIPSRLKIYEDIRRPRVERVRQTGRDIASGMQDRGYIGAYMQFLATHNAIAAAQGSLEEHRAGSHTDVQKGPIPIQVGSVEGIDGKHDEGSAVKPPRGGCCVIL